jgi:hypothetical protein
MVFTATFKNISASPESVMRNKCISDLWCVLTNNWLYIEKRILYQNEHPVLCPSVVVIVW